MDLRVSPYIVLKEGLCKKSSESLQGAFSSSYLSAKTTRYNSTQRLSPKAYFPVFDNWRGDSPQMSELRPFRGKNNSIFSLPDEIAALAEQQRVRSADIKWRINVDKCLTIRHKFQVEEALKSRSAHITHCQCVLLYRNLELDSSIRSPLSTR